MALFLWQAPVVVITFAVSLRGLLRAFRTRQARSSDLICVILFVFYGLPLVYDWIFTFHIPSYFFGAWSSQRVQFLYPLVLLATVLLVKLGAWQRRPLHGARFWHADVSLVPMRPAGVIPVFVVIAWVLLLAPVPAVMLLSDDPAAYLRYGALVAQHREGTPIQKQMIALIILICIVALFGFFVVYWVRTRYTRSGSDPVRWLSVVLVLIAAWIHGKRSMILFIFVIVGFVNFLERRLRFRTVLLYVLIGVVGGYFYIGLAKAYTRTPLEYVRGDLARDYTLRHVIYRSNWTGSELVPYRGATYIFLMTAYVPRVYWPGKPWPAPVYLTSDVFDRDADQLLGWGFGLGFMEELIMNFGYLGILGCLLIGKASAWLDRFIYARSSYYAVLWVPLVFGCVFASGVILKLIIFLVIPALLLSRIFTSPAAWIPIHPVGQYRQSSATSRKGVQ